MSVVYFKNRITAGKQAAAQLLGGQQSQNAAVVSLTTDALLVAFQLSEVLKCPLHLYLSQDVVVPGGLNVGAINQEGGFNYGSDLGAGFSDYYYQEFRGYIEDTTRQSFSKLNHELGSREVLRKELLRGRDIYLVVDCLESVGSLDSFLAYAKTFTVGKVIICAPLAMSKDMSRIQQISDNYFVAGTIDFFYGIDHYFEDNTVIPRDQAIDVVARALKLWPAT
jgi:predicted phosphoribosyltransferase